MAPVGETAAAGDVAAGMGDEAAAAGGAAAGKKGSYVPPALRGDRAGAVGERMGGSKYGDRDDLATLRVTNVGYGPGTDMCGKMLTDEFRFPRWPRNKNCEICSSALVALPESSLPRTEKPVWPRALRLSASQTAVTPRRLAARWMDLVSSILFSGWSLPKRLRKAISLVDVMG